MDIKKKNALHGRMKKGLRVILALLILGGLAAGGYHYAAGGENPGLYGEVEATIYTATAEVAGKLVRVDAAPGQQVQAGQLIATIDSTDIQHEIEQLQISLKKLQVSVSQIDTGDADKNALTAQQIAMAQAGYDSAAAAADQAAAELARAEALYADEVIARTALDQAVLQAETTRAAKNSAAAQLEAARLGYQTSTHQREALLLDMEQTRLRIDQLTEQLEKYQLYAAVSGTVVSRHYKTGDMVSPGYRLVEISADSERHLLFYCPKDEVNRLQYGDALQIGAGRESWSGTVVYLDLKSGYTPKDFQTAANKNKTSVQVKLRLPEDCPLKPGDSAYVQMPAV